jgi:site-specific DNA recombinase
VIGHLASYLSQVIDAGTPAERKAVIEALIHQIHVTPEGLIPVFKIPLPGTPIPGQPAATSSKATVRTMDSSVELRGLEPLASCMPCKRSTS